MQDDLFDVGRETILVAGCLIGWRCRFHGEETPPRKRILKWMEQGSYNVVGVCPEVMAGMAIPRPPTRYRGRKLFCNGKDVTEDFERGAKLTLMLAQAVGATKFYGLRGSPSCCPRTGVTCKLLEKNGISCVHG